jgi:hypothetical protein
MALDIEQSTSRPDLVKAELRHTVYELFDQALRSAGIHPRCRDRFIDRGDGILALIRPVDQVPKAVLLNRVIPAFSQLVASYNANLPPPMRPQRQLRVRAVVHADEVHYDANGCFGEALDIAFRLLDAAQVKRHSGRRPARWPWLSPRKSTSLSYARATKTSTSTPTGHLSACW